jgi:hypothetical protein
MEFIGSFLIGSFLIGALLGMFGGSNRSEVHINQPYTPHTPRIPDSDLKAIDAKAMDALVALFQAELDAENGKSALRFWL